MTVGDVLRASASYLPPPPDFASSPLLWGTEEHVREMFGSAASVAFERHSATIEWESIDGFLGFFMETFGPMVTARQLLGERLDSLSRDVRAIWADWNEAPDGRLVLPQSICCP